MMLSNDEKPMARPTNESLYLSQLEMLDTLLEHGAITKNQHDFSSGELTKRRIAAVNGAAKY